MAGQDAPSILAHYYQGATLGAIDPATRIRVLVLSRRVASDDQPLVIAGRVTPWTIDGLGPTFPPDARLQPSRPVADPLRSWRLAVVALDGSLLYDGAPPADLVVRPAGDDGRLQLGSKASRFNVCRGLGTRRVSGEVFRAVFNRGRPTGDPSLRSTLFDIAPIP